MSRQNSNNQYLSAPCPRRAGNYSSTGRPLTKADLSPRPLQDTKDDFYESCGWNTSDNITQNFSQNMCPKKYSVEGRPFNPLLDISANRSEKSQCPKQFSREGRPFNPALDIKSNPSRQEDSQREGRLHLEYEMAKNKEIALGRLRAEEAKAKTACPRPPLSYETQSGRCYRAPRKSSSRGKEFVIRSELQRHQQSAGQHSLNMCARPGRGNINQGRPLDVDRVYDYNLQAYSPAGPSGRPFDPQRDLTFHRKNLRTPKQQRASSCPTPVQYSTFQTPVQPATRICPRPSQSVNSSPIRSISPTEPNEQYPNATMQPRSPDFPAKYRPKSTPVCPLDATLMQSPSTVTKTVITTTTMEQPIQTPTSPSPHKATDFSHETFGDQTFRRGVEPTSPTLIYPSPQRLGESLRENLVVQTPRPGVQDSSHITQDTNRLVNSVYGQTPAKGFATRSPIKTPGQPQNIRDQSVQRSFQKSYDSVSPYSTDTKKMQMESIQQGRPMSADKRNHHNMTVPPPHPNNMHSGDLSRDYRLFEPSTTGSGLNQSYSYVDHSCDLEEDYKLLPSRALPRPKQTKAPQTSQVVAMESNNYDSSLFNEASEYRRRRRESADKSYIDLTDETLYQCDMDISEPELTTRACPVTQDYSRLMHSWRIPPEDITCQESPRDVTFSSDYCSTLVKPLTKPCEPDYDVTEYRELSQKILPNPAATCPPCEKPKASLFRCLAEKLSSTYDFLSSFVSPDKTVGPHTLPTEEQTVEQSFGPKSCPYDTTTFDLGNLYASQYPEASTLGQNTLFGTKLQLMDTPASIRECSNAKRCGRVQFDSLDKTQDPQRSFVRQAEIENLVKDTHCPGIIQETIDGLKNFNDYSFNMSLSHDTKNLTLCERLPLEDPMTLLEAFSMRIEREKSEINKDLSEKATEEQIENSIHKYFLNQNPSDLNRSIESLLISEHLMEHEVKESQDLTLEAEVQKLVTTFPENAKIKLICYTGHTKPLKDEKG